MVTQISQDNAATVEPDVNAAIAVEKNPLLTTTNTPETSTDLSKGAQEHVGGPEADPSINLEASGEKADLSEIQNAVNEAAGAEANQSLGNDSPQSANPSSEAEVVAGYDSGTSLEDARGFVEKVNKILDLFDPKNQRSAFKEKMGAFGDTKLGSVVAALMADKVKPQVIERLDAMYPGLKADDLDKLAGIVIRNMYLPDEMLEKDVADQDLIEKVFVMGDVLGYEGDSISLVPDGHMTYEELMLGMARVKHMGLHPGCGLPDKFDGFIPGPQLKGLPPDALNAPVHEGLNNFLSERWGDIHSVISIAQDNYATMTGKREGSELSPELQKEYNEAGTVSHMMRIRAPRESGTGHPAEPQYNAVVDALAELDDAIVKQLKNPGSVPDAEMDRLNEQYEQAYDDLLDAEAEHGDFVPVNAFMENLPEEVQQMVQNAIENDGFGLIGDAQTLVEKQSELKTTKQEYEIFQFGSFEIDLGVASNPEMDTIDLDLPSFTDFDLNIKLGADASIRPLKTDDLIIGISFKEALDFSKLSDSSGYIQLDFRSGNEPDFEPYIRHQHGNHNLVEGLYVGIQSHTILDGLTNTDRDRIYLGLGKDGSNYMIVGGISYPLEISENWKIVGGFDFAKEIDGDVRLGDDIHSRISLRAIYRVLGNVEIYGGTRIDELNRHKVGLDVGVGIKF